jgi:CDGSH-type Zn-finger protein
MPDICSRTAPLRSPSRVSTCIAPIRLPIRPPGRARAAAVDDPKQAPWIQPANGTLDAIRGVIAAFPPGALHVPVGNRPPQPKATGASRAGYSLCRCGVSTNKPFDDGPRHDPTWSDARAVRRHSQALRPAALTLAAAGTARPGAVRQPCRSAGWAAASDGASAAPRRAQTAPAG